MHARYRAFVGSRRKAETLRRELAEEGVPAEALAAIKAPAGLDISAISSEEIALSILAEMVAVRRRPERPAAGAETSSGDHAMTAYARRRPIALASRRRTRTSRCGPRWRWPSPRSLVPDCCLNGRHAAGFGMELFGPICHASR